MFGVANNPFAEDAPVCTCRGVSFELATTKYIGVLEGIFLYLLSLCRIFGPMYYAREVVNISTPK